MRLPGARAARAWMKRVSAWDDGLPEVLHLVDAERFAAEFAPTREPELSYIVALLFMRHARRMRVDRLGFDALAARCLAEIRRPAPDSGEVPDFLCRACRARVHDPP